MEHNTEDRLRVGVITSSHGIKGEVKVYPTTDDNDRFKTLKKCYLSNGRETLEVNCTSCKFLKNMVILKFKEYDNINDIERFKNYDILVDREDAVPLMDGEFFICDVLDADVYDQNDEHIGILDDVLETPANDVFVVKKDDGSDWGSGSSSGLVNMTVSAADKGGTTYSGTNLPVTLINAAANCGCTTATCSIQWTYL